LFATGVIYTGGKFAAGVVETGDNLPPVSTTLAKMVEKFATVVADTGGALTCEYLRKFSKKFKAVLMEYYGTGGKLIHGKN
jgi:hypothetical protein